MRETLLMLGFYVLCLVWFEMCNRRDARRMEIAKRDCPPGCEIVRRY